MWIYLKRISYLFLTCHDMCFGYTCTLLFLAMLYNIKSYFKLNWIFFKDVVYVWATHVFILIFIFSKVVCLSLLLQPFLLRFKTTLAFGKFSLWVWFMFWTLCILTIICAKVLLFKSIKERSVNTFLFMFIHFVSQV